MGEYLRTLDEAIDAVAEILELPDQRDRIIQSTVRIMMCLDAEARTFLADSQALLIEGGLEALAAKRREMVEALEDETTVAVLNPEEDGLFDSVGASLDALRLSDVAFRVFPALRRDLEPWRLARVLRRDEKAFDELVKRGIRGRGTDGHREAQASLEQLARAEAPAWLAHAAELREACRSLLHGPPQVSDTPVSDTELLFGLFAADDERTLELLGAIAMGPDAGRALAQRTFDCLTALRALDEKAA